MCHPLPIRAVFQNKILLKGWPGIILSCWHIISYIALLVGQHSPLKVLVFSLYFIVDFPLNWQLRESLLPETWLCLALIGFAGGQVEPLFEPYGFLQIVPGPKPLPNTAGLTPLTKACSIGLTSQLISPLSVRSLNFRSGIWQTGGLTDITWMCGYLYSLR